MIFLECQGTPAGGTGEPGTGTTEQQRVGRMDRSYIRTRDGILKEAQLILNLLGFICIQCSMYVVTGQGRWYTIVTHFSFWITAIFLICYVFHFVEKYSHFPWIKFEMFYCAIIAICYLIAASVVIPFPSSAFQAAAFFGFGAAIAYGVDAFFKFRAFKSGELAEGERRISKDLAALTSPTY